MTRPPRYLDRSLALMVTALAIAALALFARHILESILALIFR